MNSYNLTIVIPLYNEVENIPKLEQALGDYLKNAKAKVLFVNDGSADGSREQIEEICRRNEAFHYVHFAKNCGLSAALKAGFDLTKTPLVGYMDADLQTHPQDFDLLLEHIDEYELVTGIRTGRKDSVIKKISSTIANSIRRAFTRDGIDDTGCPLKIIRADVAKCIPMFNGMHRFLPALVMLQNGRVKQVPVRHFPRTAGKAKFGLGNRIFGPLADCFAYLWMKKKYIRYEIDEQG